MELEEKDRAHHVHSLMTDLQKNKGGNDSLYNVQQIKEEVLIQLASGSPLTLTCLFVNFLFLILEVN